MEIINKDKLGFNIDWNVKYIIGFAVLLLIPNLLGMINLPTVWGFKIHFFQIAIFLAAIIYGPKGGALAGLVGSTYSAFLMTNPYIILGNVILGFFVGLFVRYEMNVVVAVVLAYIIQLIWLVPTDLFLIGMPMIILKNLVIALLISNIIWGLVAWMVARKLAV